MHDPLNSQASIPTFSERHIKLILISILCLYPLVGMGIDLISPSLPAISRELHMSSGFSKNLITFYLIGYMLGNFLIGFLSDAIGRRQPVVWGFFIFIVASLLPTFFNSPFLLLLGRFMQGFTIAAFAISSRATLSDILSPEALMHSATFIATMWGIGPIIGPVIGGYAEFYFNWKMCFYIFALMGSVGLFAIIFIIPETHFRRQALQYQQLKNNFITIITHRNFLGIVILMGIVYSLLIVFNTLGPFLIQNTLGFSSIYFGHVALFMGVAFLAGTFLCRYFLKKQNPESILLYNILFFMFLAIISVLLAWMYGNNIWMIVISSLCMFLGSGIIYPTAMGKGLSLFRHLAGSGAAVMNLISILITSLMSFTMSFVQNDNALMIACIDLGLMLFSCAIYFFLIRSFSN